MKRLLKIELKKIIPYRTFLVLMGLYLFLLLFVTSGIGSFTINSVNLANFSLYSFPKVWHNITFVASFFNIILAIMVIIFIANEFEYRTIRQNIIDGLSRLDFILSKLLSIFLLTLTSSLFIVLLILFLGLSNTVETSHISIFTGSSFIVAYFIQLFSYLSFTLFVVFLIKRSGLAIGLLLLYSLGIEPLIAYKLPSFAASFLPLEAIGLIQNPFQSLIGIPDQIEVPLKDMVLSIIYGLSFNTLTCFRFSKMDI